MYSIFNRTLLIQFVLTNIYNENNNTNNNINKILKIKKKAVEVLWIQSVFFFSEIELYLGIKK